MASPGSCLCSNRRLTHRVCTYSPTNLFIPADVSHSHYNLTFAYHDIQRLMMPRSATYHGRDDTSYDSPLLDLGKVLLILNCFTSAWSSAIYSIYHHCLNPPSTLRVNHCFELNRHINPPRVFPLRIRKFVRSTSLYSFLRLPSFSAIHTLSYFWRSDFIDNSIDEYISKYIY